jgi:hypothetical protein
MNKHVGTISNEKGIFSINTSSLQQSDTLVFQYVGYKTRKIAIADLAKDETGFHGRRNIQSQRIIDFCQ